MWHMFVVKAIFPDPETKCTAEAAVATAVLCVYFGMAADGALLFNIVAPWGDTEFVYKKALAQNASD